MGKVQSLEKGDAGCNNLFLDQDLRTKEKMSKFLKAARAASFYRKISPGTGRELGEEPICFLSPLD